MKRNDDFLRNYKKTPRQAFSDGLYRRLSGQKSFANWLKRGAVWGVMAAALIFSLSGNLLAWSGQEGALPAEDAAKGVQARQINLALVGEQGLQPDEFIPTPAGDDWLGPFDRPLHVNRPVEVVEIQEFAAEIPPMIRR